MFYVFEAIKLSLLDAEGRYKHRPVSVLMYSYRQFFLAPGCCTVGYKQLFMCTLIVQYDEICTAWPKPISTTPIPKRNAKIMCKNT